MRHRVSGRKLSRSASHRRSLLRSLSTELIRHKRITTTEAKAKEAGRFAETIITRAKRAYLSEQDGGAVDLHARRIIARDIHDRDVMSELFGNIAPKVSERPGGYTRVIRIGRRNGDGAEMAILELVDYNTERDESAARSRTKQVMSRAERVRRSQEKQKSADDSDSSAAAGVVAAEEAVAEAEEKVDAVVAEENTAAEADTAEKSGEDSDDAPASEEGDDEKKSDS